uniref:Ribosomal protein S13 n=1 Tax=Eustigmatophyceae sp. Bat 8/9-7w TaxID=2506144 RepID=A0A451FLX1_9STRA|nr:ribosomal protein S13 [Eustigmatophyceae sp. Bat 8/9-7w]QAA11380.1 ribosomal protein S13 [Eustigmatophyceae sp. Bat 8/9-7w]
MVRISGVDLPDQKHIEIALTYIYGIGPTRAVKILKAAEVDPIKRTKNLTDLEVSRLRDIIENNYVTEGDLRRLVTLNIKRLIEINCYRGRRHIQGLPVRGQRTKTNSQTRKRERARSGTKKFK